MCGAVTEKCLYCQSETEDGLCMQIGCGICGDCGRRLDDSGACERCESAAKIEAATTAYAEHAAAWSAYVSAVTAALPGVEFRHAQSNSAYAIFLRADIRLKIRVSDHRQVAGGGFNEGTGERAGDADVQYVMGRDSSDRAAVRARLAAAIRAAR